MRAPPEARLDQTEVGRIFREESGRSVAALIRLFGDIDIAEDAVQEAFAVALRKWPVGGVPANPGAWITTTARNRAIDRLRRESRGRELLDEMALLSPGDVDGGVPEGERPVQDDRLRLIFTCCHPVSSTTPGWRARSNPASARRRSAWHGSSRRSCQKSRRWPACWRCCS